MDDSKAITKFFKPYTLEHPGWFWGTGFSKGIYHDRQPLGVILPAGARISIRRSSAIDRVLQLDLLNDSGVTETYIRITGEWAGLTVTHPSVPFVLTPYEPIDVEIEYSTSGDEVLPIYVSNGNADLFFQQWDETDSAFALIQTTYASLLVPAVDKAVVKALHQAQGLDSLEKYYTGVFEYFNSLAGISFDTPVPTDKNIHNRYFIKADKTGGGSAYYGNGWTAQVGDSIASCWLDTRADNWCSLHEIAHGYQTYAMYNSVVPTGEVWNNIYATYYQHKMMGQSVYERGWMYAGNAQATFDAMRSRMDSSVPPGRWHLHEVLFLFMIIIDKAGESAFTEFNQYYRALATTNGFDLWEHPLMDLFSARWADRLNIDIGPLMALLEVEVSADRALKNVYGNFRPCCPLYRVVPPEQLAYLQQQLNLKTPFSLVDCLSLNVTDLKGDLTLEMTNQAYLENKNKSVILRTGSNQSHIVKVTSPVLELKGLPIGVYNLQHPAVPSGVRTINHNYLEVSANMNNNVSLDYAYAQGTSLASQKIEFFGLYGLFAVLNVDMEFHRATFNVLRAEPHSYYGTSVYAGISVEDINGFVLFDLSIPGKGAVVFVHEFLIGPGCTVTIHHKEPSRLSETPNLQPFIDKASVDNTLTVTVQGLRNLKLDNRPANNLKTRIALAADEIRKTPHLLLHAGSSPVMDVLAAINTFESPERDQLLESIRDLIVFYGDTGDAGVAGSYFTWRQSGVGQGTVADIKIDTVTQQVAIEVLAAKPHGYFPSIYIAMWVRTATGEVLYSQELRGDVQAEPSYVTLPFVEGSTVSVLHLEPVRSVIVNTDTQAQYPVRQIHVVRSLGGGKLQI